MDISVQELADKVTGDMEPDTIKYCDIIDKEIMSYMGIYYNVSPYRFCNFINTSIANKSANINSERKIVTIVYSNVQFPDPVGKCKRLSTCYRNTLENIIANISADMANGHNYFSVTVDKECLDYILTELTVKGFRFETYDAFNGRGGKTIRIEWG